MRLFLERRKVGTNAPAAFENRRAGLLGSLVVLGLLLAASPAKAEDAGAEQPSPEVPELLYVERVTAGADPAMPLPMIVAIHGLGDTPESFLHLFDGFSEPARVIAPRGPIPMGKGFSWFETSPGGKEAFEAELITVTDQLMALIRKTIFTRPSEGRVVVTGFSQGAILSFSIAARDGDLFTVAAPIAGFLPPGLETPAGNSPPRIEAFHGEADKRIQFELGQQTIERLKAAGYEATMHSYEGLDHAMSPDMHRKHRALLLEAVASKKAPPQPEGHGHDHDHEVGKAAPAPQHP